MHVTAKGARPGRLIFALLAGLAWSGGLRAEERVYFAFDDVNLGWRHNLKLTLEPPQKHPENPVLRRGPKGTPDHGHAVLYGTVLHDGEKFRMWYLGMFDREVIGGIVPGWWRPMLYAESEDGVHWVKPNLGLVDFNGNKNNNMVLIEGAVESMTKVNDFLTVLHDPDDPDPSKRFKAAYIAHMPYDDIKGGMSTVGVKEPRVGAIITATSADGLKWQVVGDRPANAGGERFEVSGLYKFGNFYYASGQLVSPWAWLPNGENVGRIMQTYRSSDFEHWSRAKATSMVLSRQATDPPRYSLDEMLAGYGLQMHMGVATWNRGNMLVGIHGIWNPLPDSRPDGTEPLHGLRIDLGLSLSNDGVNFREAVPEYRLLTPGKEGEWDSVALLQAHAMVNVEDSTYIWYSHWDAEGKYRGEEIGLATMRRDGFGYLSRHSQGETGHCLSALAPANDEGSAVYVNVAGVDEDHPLKVELLDENDRPIAGYSGDAAARVAAEGTRVAVKWPSAGERTPAATAFALKITLPDRDDARLYAAYVED